MRRPAGAFEPGGRALSMNDTPQYTRLSIIMPAFNERLTIREIVRRVLAVDLGGLEKRADHCR